MLDRSPRPHQTKVGEYDMHSKLYIIIHCYIKSYIRDTCFVHYAMNIWQYKEICMYIIQSTYIWKNFSSEDTFRAVHAQQSFLSSPVILVPCIRSAIDQDLLGPSICPWIFESMFIKPFWSLSFSLYIGVMPWIDLFHR